MSMKMHQDVPILVIKYNFRSGDGWYHRATKQAITWGNVDGADQLFEMISCHYQKWVNATKYNIFDSSFETYSV